MLKCTFSQGHIWLSEKQGVCSQSSASASWPSDSQIKTFELGFEWKHGEHDSDKVCQGWLFLLWSFSCALKEYETLCPCYEINLYVTVVTLKFKMKQCYNMKAFSGLIHCRINCKLEQDNHLCRIHLNNVEKSYSLWWLLFGASTHCLQTVTYHVIEIHFKSLLQGRTPSPFPLLSFSPSRDWEAKVCVAWARARNRSIVLPWAGSDGHKCF